MEHCQTSMLLSSVDDGYYEHVKNIIDIKTPLDAKDKIGRNALIIACIRGYPDIVRLLLNAKIDVNLRDYYGFDAIYYGILSENLEIINLLLVTGVDINSRSRNVYPLGVAFEKRNLKLFKFLINKGADVNIDHGYYKSLIHATYENNEIEFFSILIEHEADKYYDEKFTFLADACLYKKKFVGKLLQLGFDPNEERALICSMTLGLSYINMFRKYGANIHNKFEDGYTLLHYACILCNYKIIEFLLKNGLDPNEANVNGITPFMKAFDCNKNIIKLLISHGAQIVPHIQ